MSIESAGIYSDRSDLMSRLRKACPSWTFPDDAAERDACRIAVVDGAFDRLPGKSIVRILLNEGTERRQGELRLNRELFLGNPSEYLAFASDLAEAAVHAASLEHETIYLRQIHELMTMVDAEAVSERITTTVLELLQLPAGTLFLHDPRLERYVVSYSNDPSYRETGEFLPGIPPDLLQKALASPQLFAVGGGLVAMPLQVREDLLGVIRVPIARGETIGEDAANNVTRYLSAVAQVLSNIYQLTRSRDLAMRDDLTKAYNRRFFETYLDEEIERARRYGSLFSIIFLDLDDLKMVNNLYGHLSGSRTLAGSRETHPRRRPRHRQSRPLRRRRVLRHPPANGPGPGRRRRPPRRPRRRRLPPPHRPRNRSLHHRQLRHRHLPHARDDEREFDPPGGCRDVPGEVDDEECGGGCAGGGCHETRDVSWRAA